MSKEPTRAQLSSRLSYQAKTPAFLLRMQQNTLGGRGDDEDDEFEYDGSGRPPRRPAISERPDDEPGSADEDDDEEGPQVVVLKEGKHLSATEVENEKRKGMLLQMLCWVSYEDFHHKLRASLHYPNRPRVKSLDRIRQRRVPRQLRNHPLRLRVSLSHLGLLRRAKVPSGRLSAMDAMTLTSRSPR
ncbi:hypothetical protein BD413DRAFT_291765 [Trametes elegans]|nr:hypothetical protein BD413DRAFT_291765 [Trametes elegans]